MKYIYTIVEENIDGCGDYATEYVTSEYPLTQAEQQLLKECLDTVKQEAIKNDKCMDTSDMVSDAINRFKEKTGKTLIQDCDAIQGYITF